MCVRYEGWGIYEKFYQVLFFDAAIHLGRGWLAPGEAEEEVIL